LHALRIFAGRPARQLFLTGLQAQLLNLARQRVAADAEQLGGLDAPSAGVLQRAGDEGAFELAGEQIADPGFAA
jgi:hypothetical protein